MDPLAWRLDCNCTGAFLTLFQQFNPDRLIVLSTNYETFLYLSGSSFTSKLENMFKDMEVSKEINREFQQVWRFFICVVGFGDMTFFCSSSYLVVRFLSLPLKRASFLFLEFETRVVAIRALSFRIKNNFHFYILFCPFSLIPFLYLFYFQYLSTPAASPEAAAAARQVEFSTQVLTTVGKNGFYILNLIKMFFLYSYLMR